MHWVPKSLCDEQKVTIALANSEPLKRFRSNAGDFLLRLVTEDVNWAALSKANHS